MKLEKREIALNEMDSLKDALYTEKILLNEYVHVFTHTISKATRNELSELIAQVGDDALLVCDLLRNSIKQNA